MGCELNYMTYKFLHDHVYIKWSDDRRAGKKEAENAYQRRSVSTNTLLCLDPKDMRQLYAEVQNRQDEYRNDDSGGARHGTIYTSLDAYPYFERTGKRSKAYAPRHFKYGVKKEGEQYKIHHLDGIV